MKKGKTGLIFIVLFLLFAVSLCLCLFFNLNFSETENTKIILNYIRMPAVIKAIAAGSCLALSGMFLQTVSKNPLADPYLTGLSSGAALGIIFSILCFNSINYPIFGFAGALISAFCVIALSGFSKFSVTKLILIGLSVNLFAGSIISFLILTNPEKAYAMTLILTGGFTNTEISNRLLVALFVGAIVITALFIPKLNVLNLDYRLGFKNQKNADRWSILFIILATFLASISVYCAGILGFAGIICPLLCKMLFGGDHRLLFFGNILTGSSLLLLSNFLANNAVYPLVIPLGVVVAILGTPCFVYFLLKKGGILG